MPIRGITLYQVQETSKEGDKVWIACGDMLADGTQSTCTVNYYQAKRCVSEMQAKNPDKGYEVIWGETLVT